jgi:hypothetical protein
MPGQILGGTVEALLGFAWCVLDVLDGGQIPLPFCVLRGPQRYVAPGQVTW